MYTVSGIENDTRRLQFWNAETRHYEPSAHQGDLDSDNVRAFACGRPWRIAKADRPLKDPKHRPPRKGSKGWSSAAMMDPVKAITDEYMAWALERKLPSITMWLNQYHVATCKFRSIKRVDPATYFTVEEATE